MHHRVGNPLYCLCQMWKLSAEQCWNNTLFARWRWGRYVMKMATLYASPLMTFLQVRTILVHLGLMTCVYCKLTQAPGLPKKYNWKHHSLTLRLCVNIFTYLLFIFPFGDAMQCFSFVYYFVFIPFLRISIQLYGERRKISLKK